MAISLIRTLIIYFAIVLSMRVMGKRQIGELAPSELVVAVLISDLASHPMQDMGIPLLYGLLPILVLLSCEVLLSSLISHSVRFRSFLCGKPSMIITNGRIDQQEMKRNKYTPDDLQESLRSNGVIDILSVMNAVLETDGTLSVILQPDSSPVTPKTMNIPAQPYGYPITLISEGRMLKDNLVLLGKDETWLRKRLKDLKINSPDDVYLFTSDPAGKIYCARMEN